MWPAQHQTMLRWVSDCAVLKTITIIVGPSALNTAHVAATQHGDLGTVWTIAALRNVKYPPQITNALDAYTRIRRKRPSIEQLKDSVKPSDKLAALAWKLLHPVNDMQFRLAGSSDAATLVETALRPDFLKHRAQSLSTIAAALIKIANHSHASPDAEK